MIHVVALNPALDRTVILKEFNHDGVSRAKESMDLLGGKGFNVVRSLLAGEERPPFQIHSFLGGYIGDILQSFIREKGMDARITNITGTTRICSVIVDEQRNEVHLINETGPPITQAEKDELYSSLLAQTKPGDYVIFSGSLPQGVEPEFYQTAIRTLEEKGAHCILDSSGLPLEHGVHANPWLLKVNEHEFTELVSPGEEQNQSLETMVAEFDQAQNVIITLGKNGALAKLNQQLYQVELPTIEARNATASGDIFLGALIKTFDQGASMEEALQTANAYSLSNCLSWFPHINMQDVETFKPNIKVTRLRS